ncbi:MAG: hypothetical protein HY044_00470 [Candidatus Woesebacteria bacterium]|nr:MAG: hypothetical protein HY044_00470 [Candidatus Woesebacteria bacterium]
MQLRLETKSQKTNLKPHPTGDGQYEKVHPLLKSIQKVKVKLKSCIKIADH